MTIRRRLQLTAIIALVLAVIVGFAVVYSASKVNHEIIEIRYITDLFREVAELRFVATEYLLSEDADLDRVFEDKYERVRIFEKMPEMFNHDGEEEIARDMEQGFASLGEVFAVIKENDLRVSSVAFDLEKRMIGQFLVKSQTVMDDAFRMQALNQRQIQYAQIMALLAISFAVMTMFGILLVVAFLINLKILRPMLGLEKGLGIISGGDYDYRMPAIGRHDEIANLVGSFNLMAGQLKQSRDKAMSLLDDVKKFQEAVEAVNYHIIFTNPDGVILYANKAATKTTGYSLEEIVGQRPSLWGNQMGKEFYQRLWETVKIRKQPFSAEIKNKRKNGDFYIADSLIIPILDDSKNVKFFVGVERDITKEKAVDAAKTEFVSVASHQLRTPLSAMKWTTELLMENKKLSKKEKDRLLDMEQSTERLISLVNNLLNISRIESGKALGVKGVVALRTILEDALNSLRMAAESKRQKLELAFTGAVGDVFIVTLSIIEAIKIIVSNAINYAAENSEIRVQVSSQDGHYLIGIHNDGSYIPEEDRPRMFEKFFRGSVAKKTKTEGSGLGLFIAKASIEANGGKIWVESDQKTGTTFFLTIPKFEEK